MKFYKDAANQVYAYESDGSQDHYIMPGLIAITQSEADAIRNPAPTLDQIKAKKITELSAACQQQIYAGFDSSALGTIYHYPAKDRDQSNMAASVLDSVLPNLPTTWTTPFWCADAAGVWALRDHTAAQIQQVGKDGKAAILAAISKNDSLATQVRAATTEAAVAAIVW